MRRTTLKTTIVVGALLFLMVEISLLLFVWKASESSNQWTEVAAMATTLYTLVFSVTVPILAWQVYALRRATSAQTLSVLWRDLANMHRTREALFRSLRKKVDILADLEDPPNDNARQMRDDAETVANAYEEVGAMIRFGYLDEEVVVPNHANSIRMVWRAALPLTHKYRGTATAGLRDGRMTDFWRNFEWLSRRAWKHGQRIGDIPKDLPFPATKRELDSRMKDYDPVTTPRAVTCRAE